MRHFICPALAAAIIVMSGCGGGGGGGSSVTVTPDNTTPVISSVSTSDLSLSRLMTITAVVTDPGGVSTVVAEVRGGSGITTSVVKGTTALITTVILTGPLGGGTFTGTVDLKENGTVTAIPVLVTVTATDSTPHSVSSPATTEIPTSPPPASP